MEKPNLNDPLKSLETNLKPGQPCGHPGCAFHLSHPCEGCGRYAAGMANGPDIDSVKQYINYLSLNDATIYHVISASRQLDWTWEQTLSAMVIALQKENQELFKRLYDQISTSAVPRQLPLIKGE